MAETIFPVVCNALLYRSRSQPPAVKAGRVAPIRYLGVSRYCRRHAAFKPLRSSSLAILSSLFALAASMTAFVIAII